MEKYGALIVFEAVLYYCITDDGAKVDDLLPWTWTLSWTIGILWFANRFGFQYTVILNLIGLFLIKLARDWPWRVFRRELILMAVITAFDFGFKALTTAWAPAVGILPATLAETLCIAAAYHFITMMTEGEKRTVPLALNLIFPALGLMVLFYAYALAAVAPKDAGAYATKIGLLVWALNIAFGFINIHMRQSEREAVMSAMAEETKRSMAYYEKLQASNDAMLKVLHDLKNVALERGDKQVLSTLKVTRTYTSLSEILNMYLSDEKDRLKEGGVSLDADFGHTSFPLKDEDVMTLLSPLFTCARESDNVTRMSVRLRRMHITSLKVTYDTENPAALIRLKLSLEALGGLLEKCGGSWRLASKDGQTIVSFLLQEEIQ